MNKQPQNLPARNHYIPQFYLKGFSNDGINIYRLDKATTEIKLLPIPSVGYEKNIYTYRTINHTNDTLEKLFSQIEGQAATYIDKLRANLELSEQEKADLSIFLSFQMLRTPASQNKVLGVETELREQFIRMTMEMTPPERIQEFFKSRGENMTVEQAKDIIDFGANKKRSKIEFDFPQEYWIKGMLKMAMELCPIFQICDWEIRHSIKKNGFITSDHPFLLVAGEKPHPFYGVGLLTPKSKKIIPLASDICLVAHDPNEKPNIVHTEADKNFYRKINKYTLANAERYVFSSDLGKIEKLRKENKNLLKRPKRFSVS